jgi:uncharacterized protein (TIGR00266 family)
MDYVIKHAPMFTILEVHLGEAEHIVAQPNSMLSMTSGIQLRAAAGRGGSGTGGNIFSGFKSVLGGENFFTAEFHSKRDGQTVVLAPDSYGDILTINLEGAGGFFLTRGSYLANIGPCELKVKYGGVKGFLAKTGLFLLHARGEGSVFCQTFGATIEKVLNEGENFFIDNRYVIAFSDTVQYQLVKATESLKDSIFSGEGLVNRFTGPGKVFYQTRGKPAESWLARILGATF